LCLACLGKTRRPFSKPPSTLVAGSRATMQKVCAGSYALLRRAERRRALPHRLQWRFVTGEAWRFRLNVADPTSVTVSEEGREARGGGSGLEHGPGKRHHWLSPSFNVGVDLRSFNVGVDLRDLRGILPQSRYFFSFPTASIIVSYSCIDVCKGEAKSVKGVPISLTARLFRIGRARLSPQSPSDLAAAITSSVTTPSFSHFCRRFTHAS